MREVSDAFLLNMAEVSAEVGLDNLPNGTELSKPRREDFTWAILVSFAIAFLSLMTVVLSVFDLARMRELE